nr:PREDICTED: SH2 domain-containing adapter protein F isoform X2 [Latimeria chalumnae]|eukprot:XP_006001906.1 PREDICTED: SH2 domain-containing adapter protein F isoform X2 [Latimeria chalumnae]
MAKWFKEHLGFKSTKPSPPAPPKPDYRHCHPGVPGTPLYHSGAAPGTPLYLTGTQPDILAAYKLQKERDFEDPYIGSAGSFPGGVSSASPEVKYISPKHRLIKVEAAEKGSSGAGSNSAAPAAAVVGVKSPTSPPAEDCKQEKLIILEDYADPFDAKQAGGGQVVQEKVPENDGYMEPYEAQKMMAEIRRRGSKDTPSKPLHLYDTPYEPAENGTDSDTEKSMCQRPRESRLPEDDERPPEEYDQPWEWKKDRISKAFAVEIKVIKDLPWPPPVGQLDSSPTKPDGEVPVSYSQQHHHSALPHVQSQHSTEDNNVQFDGTDKNRLSPSKEEKVRQPHRHSSGNLKTLKLQSMEQHSGAIGERIDPALALENQFWYHGAISRTDAENLLRLCKEASYLVRNSETSKNDYSLSLKFAKWTCQDLS